MLGLDRIGMHFNRRGIIRQNLQNLFRVLIGLREHRLRRLIECLSATELRHFLRHVRIANDRFRRLNVIAAVLEISRREIDALMNCADIRLMFKQSAYQTLENIDCLFRIALRSDLQPLAVFVNQAEPVSRHVEQTDVHLVIGGSANLELETAALIAARDVIFLPRNLESLHEGGR